MATTSYYKSHFLQNYLSFIDLIEVPMRLHFNPSRLKPGCDKLMKSSALKAERLHLLIFNKIFFSFMRFSRFYTQILRASWTLKSFAITTWSHWKRLIPQWDVLSEKSLKKTELTHAIAYRNRDTDDVTESCFSTSFPEFSLLLRERQERELWERGCCFLCLFICFCYGSLPSMAYSTGCVFAILSD